MENRGFIRSNADRLITLRIQVMMLLYLIYALSGCSVAFEVGYHGRTGRDDLKASPELLEANVKSRRY